MKRLIIILIPSLFLFAASALACEPFGRQDGGATGATGMMGSLNVFGFGFLMQLFTLIIWGLIVALLVALVRFVWLKGTQKK